jgi:hypothetical protein
LNLVKWYLHFCRQLVNLQRLRLRIIPTDID